MASQEIYYIPDGSKWPIVGTLSLFITFLGGAMMFNSVDSGKYVLIIGLAALGKKGANHVHDILKDELSNIMEQICAKNIEELKCQKVMLSDDFKIQNFI